MKEDLSTFPVFQKSLEECKGDWEKAQAEYFIKVSNWHTNIVIETAQLLRSDKALEGITPRMILTELLGTNNKKP